MPINCTVWRRNHCLSFLLHFRTFAVRFSANQPPSERSSELQLSPCRSHFRIKKQKCTKQLIFSVWWRHNPHPPHPQHVRGFSHSSLVGLAFLLQAFDLEVLQSQLNSEFAPIRNHQRSKCGALFLRNYFLLIWNKNKIKVERFRGRFQWNRASNWRHCFAT